MAYYAGPHGKTPGGGGGQEKEDRDSLKNYGGLWAIGMASSCLVSDPRIIEAEEYCLLGHMGQIEEIRLWTG